MDEQTIIETLVENGGKLWQKNGKRRVYFNASLVARLGGLTFHTYNTGHISSAELCGEEISNNKASKTMAQLELCSFYYDLVDKKFEHGCLKPV
jgi:hypothetical protein